MVDFAGAQGAERSTTHSCAAPTAPHFSIRWSWLLRR